MSPDRLTLSSPAEFQLVKALVASGLMTAATDYSFLERLPHLERLSLAYLPIPDWSAQVRRLARLREMSRHYMDLARLPELIDRHSHESPVK